MFYSIFAKTERQKDMKRLIYILLSWALPIVSFAQVNIGSGLTLDKTTHDFGDILMEDGPVSCTYTVTNNGNKASVIYNVISSCGCTDVKWTREPIRPGEKGKISVTYSNDEGAYPFDKNLTVYFSDIKKPVILKIRGVSHNKKKSLEELYPITFGPLGLKESYIKCGNLEQKGQRSDAVNIANLSDKPIKVEFEGISDNLSIKLSSNPIPARKTAVMTFTVTASRDKWGKNDYWATPVINGKTYKNADGKDKIGIWAFTKENFSHLTQEQKENGPLPAFYESSHSFGKVKKGETVTAEFVVRNDGGETLRIYKVDVNSCKWSHSVIPIVAPMKEEKFRVHLDTSGLPLGESLTIITLVTNSPLQPIVNLFIAGIVE